MNRESNIQVIGKLKNGQELMSCADVLNPDVVLVGMKFNKSSALKTFRLIRQILPDVGIVAMTFNEDLLDDAALQSAGIQATILSDAGIDDIIQCINKVVDHEAYSSATSRTFPRTLNKK